MKMKSWAMLMVLSLMSVSCADEIIEPELEDMKAQKMRQLYSMFEQIARQPVMAEELIQAAEIALYHDYTELLPLDDAHEDARGMARGYAIGGMMLGVSRNPEIAGLMDTTAMKFLGAYHPDEISDEILEYSQSEAYFYLAEAIARNPETLEILNNICKKYLDFSIDTNPLK